MPPAFWDWNMTGCRSASRSGQRFCSRRHSAAAASFEGALLSCTSTPSLGEPALGTPVLTRLPAAGLASAGPALVGPAPVAATVAGAPPAGATLGGTTLGGATIGGAIVGGATLGSATFSGATRTGTTAGGATVGGATVGGATFARAALSGMTLAEPAAAGPPSDVASARATCVLRGVPATRAAPDGGFAAAKMDSAWVTCSGGRSWARICSAPLRSPPMASTAARS